MPTSASSRRSPAAPGASAGFTLLEVLLVMGLVAGAMVMLAGAISRAGDGPRLRAETAQMANGLREARNRALLSQRPQSFVLEPGARRWQAGDGPMRQVPAGIELRMVTAEALRTDHGGAIMFFPDGASTGGRVELSRAGQVWRLDVNWLTGEVRSQRLGSP